MRNRRAINAGRRPLPGAMVKEKWSQCPVGGRNPGAMVKEKRSQCPVGGRHPGVWSKRSALNAGRRSTPGAMVKEKRSQCR